MRHATLDLALYYTHETAGLWTFAQLSKGEGALPPQEVRGAAFDEITGGLRALFDRIYRFLDTEAAGDLLSYVHFLMGSLASLGEGSIDESMALLKPEAALMGEGDIVGSLVQLDQSRLILRRDGEELALDYRDPDGRSPPERLSPYFEGLSIERGQWIQAASLALEEYFIVVEGLESVKSTRAGTLLRTWMKNRALFGV